ncbi:hypothetical protein DPMN_158000 [Dreissena polymorpha]|uniref:Uncharacterized protein n=1 Tax=Dreissena polymorpha TaxID=45954 RepID=A0A9D4EGI2_DREPO|nr:hypothetical protein DPMN_158000 [Dreissena polymorpha]
MLTIDVLNEILESSSGENKNIFALIERIKSTKVQEKRSVADIDVSDTDMSDTLDDDEQQIMNALAAKRTRTTGVKKQKKETPMLSDLEMSVEDQ